MAKIHIDFETMDTDNKTIETVLLAAMDEAVLLNREVIECNPGKISNDLRKRVLHLLEKPEVRRRYYKLEKGGKNSGKLQILFRHPNTRGYHG
jgi:hypothetical protein